MSGWDFRRTFAPTPEEELEDMEKADQALREWKDERTCGSCVHRDNTIVGKPPFQEENGTCEILREFVSSCETCGSYEERLDDPEIAANREKRKLELKALISAKKKAWAENGRCGTCAKAMPEKANGAWYVKCSLRGKYYAATGGINCGAYRPSEIEQYVAERGWERNAEKES